MADTATLLRLMSWLSPVFPTGGFAYSAGLEQAVRDGLAGNEEALATWIGASITHGTSWNDAVFLAASHGTDDRPSVTELAIAMATSRARLDEMTDQGTSFVDAAASWFETDALPPRGTPLCICIGAAAARSGISAEAAIAAFVHAFVSNQLQCAIRLSVIGQSGAARLLARLEPVIAATALRASHSTLEDLGTATIMADIAAMKHETLQPRLFLS